MYCSYQNEPEVLLNRMRLNLDDVFVCGRGTYVHMFCLTTQRSL